MLAKHCFNWLFGFFLYLNEYLSFFYLNIIALIILNKINNDKITLNILLKKRDKFEYIDNK